jgi:hypothetical protein
MSFTFSYRLPIVEQKSHFCNLPDCSPIFQLEYAIERRKVINPDVIARIEEIPMTNRQMSSVAISQAIRDAPELPSISPTAISEPFENL